MPQGGAVQPEPRVFFHPSTDGNPLFMGNTVDYLVQQRIVSEQDGRWQLCTPLHEVAVGVPENVRQLIDKQIERLAVR
jgi:hypothetical protein